MSYPAQNIPLYISLTLFPAIVWSGQEILLSFWQFRIKLVVVLSHTCERRSLSTPKPPPPLEEIYPPYYLKDQLQRTFLPYLYLLSMSYVHIVICIQLLSKAQFIFQLFFFLFEYSLPYSKFLVAFHSYLFGLFTEFFLREDTRKEYRSE